MVLQHLWKRMCYNLLGQVKSAISIKHTRECNVISNPPSPSQTLPNPNSPRKSTKLFIRKKNEANTLWKHPAPADKHEDRLFWMVAKPCTCQAKLTLHFLLATPGKNTHFCYQKSKTTYFTCTKCKCWENMEKQMTFEATRDTRFAGICNIM